MPYTSAIAALCADNGARVLDTCDPNWAFHIEKNRLDMLSQRNCIIGQLYPGDMPASGPDAYYRWYEQLDALLDDMRAQSTLTGLIAERGVLYESFVDEGDYLNAVFLGFDIPGNDDDLDTTEGYAMLRFAWIGEIEKRIA